MDDLHVPIEEIKGQGETVLVVDDEEVQREVSSKMLNALGILKVKNKKAIL